jgi:predicted nucleic acid-binding protein
VTVFVDTSAFIAFLDGDDPAHRGCREAWERAARDAEALVTTDYNVVETIAVAQRRWGLDAVRTFADGYLPLVEVEDVTTGDRNAALAALLAAGRRQLSLVDIVGFGVMRRMDIDRYLGTDTHFAEHGFTPVVQTGE